MSDIHTVDILIVGAGPASMSTALHLAKANPNWARRVVAIEKAIHPREKLCGGGVTKLGEDVLHNLGLSFVPAHVPIRELRLVYQNSMYAIRDDPVFRVVRRDEFDHWLVQCAEQRGVTVRQGETVKAITPHQDFVEVVTEKAIFHTKILVGADGSRSIVRQSLKWHDGQRMARLLEVLTPENAEKREDFQKGVAIFDFSRIKSGLQGYYWDFPSLIKGQPFMNRGVFDSRARPERPRASLKQLLKEALAERDRNLEDYQLKGHPIHWFDSEGQFAIPRVILAGDAAGVDPMLGEGISFALAYGDVAATAIVDAFSREDFSFANYKKQIFQHTILSQLRTRATAARVAYYLKSPRLLGWMWKMIPFVVRMTAMLRPTHIPVTTPRILKLRNEHH